MFFKKTGLISTGRSMIFSASILRGKPFVTPLMLEDNMLCVRSFIVVGFDLGFSRVLVCVCVCF